MEQQRDSAHKSPIDNSRFENPRFKNSKNENVRFDDEFNDKNLNYTQDSVFDKSRNEVYNTPKAWYAMYNTKNLGIPSYMPSFKV